MCSKCVTSCVEIVSTTNNNDNNNNISNEIECKLMIISWWECYCFISKMDFLCVIRFQERTRATFLIPRTIDDLVML